MSDSPVFSFFNEHPVFPVIVLTTSAFAVVPIIILIYISQIAPLHGNCRYILCAWVTGLAASLFIESALAVVDLNNDTGYMAMSMILPLMRVKMYKSHVVCATFCSTMEVALSTERMISVIRPRHYHFSKTAWKTLIVLTIVLMANAFLVDEGLHVENELLRSIASAAMAFTEIAVLAVGATAAKLCGDKYRELFGNSSLAERYQAKEAYEMSKAMIPAYIISFILKTSTVTAISLYVLFIRDGYLTGYLQNYIIMAHLCNIIFSTSNLLLIHPLLRKYTERKFKSLMHLKADLRVQDNSVSADADTETYFSMYSVYWK